MLNPLSIYRLARKSVKEKEPGASTAGIPRRPQSNTAVTSGMKKPHVGPSDVSEGMTLDSINVLPRYEDRGDGHPRGELLPPVVETQGADPRAPSFHFPPVTNFSGGDMPSHVVDTPISLAQTGPSWVFLHESLPGTLGDGGDGLDLGDLQAHLDWNLDDPVGYE